LQGFFENNSKKIFEKSIDKAVRVWYNIGGGPCGRPFKDRFRETAGCTKVIQFGYKICENCTKNEIRPLDACEGGGQKTTP
jgi:hypothetical protein